MPTPLPPRRFNLVDAIVLVAATAAGLAVIRSSWDWWWLYEPMDDWTPAEVCSQVAQAFFIGLPCLVMGNLALLALRLRRPRPPLRNVVLQPGMAAGLAVAVCAVGGISKYLGFYVVRGEFLGRNFPEYVLEGIQFQISPAVAVTWLVLWLSRRGRLEKSWIDRAGRAFGVLWIVGELFGWWYGVYHE